MDTEQVITAIRKHTRNTSIRRRHRKESYFIQYCYSQWAVDEIIKSIQKNGSKPPITVVEDFVRKMDEYSCVNPNTSLIFSIAKDSAMDILDLLIVMR